MVDIPRGEASRYTPTLRGIVVLVFTKLSWIKTKKVTFVNKKSHLVGTLFTITTYLGILSSAFL